MAKGNLFLGFARGKIGDTVFYRQYGEQCSRGRNRHPSNPQTPLQLLQRVCMKTSSLAFSMLQDITNHSFQGRAEGTPCQSRFTELNIAKFRQQLSTYINSGDDQEILTCQETNFSKKGSYLPEVMPYIVSEGMLPSVPVSFANSAFCIPFPAGSLATPADGPTYQEVCDALGVNKGDQLTFLVLASDDRSGADIDSGVFNRFSYARVILDPSDGDMTSSFIDSDGVVNKPNPKNEGIVDFNWNTSSMTLDFSISGIDVSTGMKYSATAATVIVSRLSNGTWQRSTQALVIRPSTVSVPGHLTYDHNVDTLADALASYMTAQTSSLYLNQATV